MQHCRSHYYEDFPTRCLDDCRHVGMVGWAPRELILRAISTEGSESVTGSQVSSGWCVSVMMREIAEVGGAGFDG